MQKGKKVIKMDKKITTPLQLGQEGKNDPETLDWTAYVENGTKVLALGKPLIFSLSEDQFIKMPVPDRIIEHCGHYISVRKAKDDKDKDSYYLEIKRITNYKLKLVKTIISKDINNPDLAEEMELELVAINNNGKETKPVKLKGSDKRGLQDFRQTIYSYGNFIDCFKFVEFAQILDDLYSKTDIPEYYCYKTQGLIPDKNIWLMDNAIIELNTGQVHYITKTKEVKDAS